MLAKSLKRPENFCGMHFFNPVHRMPLVEIIKGEKPVNRLLIVLLVTPVKWAKHQLLLMIAPAFRKSSPLPLFCGILSLAKRRC